MPIDTRGHTYTLPRVSPDMIALAPQPVQAAWTALTALHARYGEVRSASRTLDNEAHDEARNAAVRAAQAIRDGKPAPPSQEADLRQQAADLAAEASGLAIACDDAERRWLAECEANRAEWANTVRDTTRGVVQAAHEHVAGMRALLAEVSLLATTWTWCAPEVGRESFPDRAPHGGPSVHIHIGHDHYAHHRVLNAIDSALDSLDPDKVLARIEAERAAEAERIEEMNRYRRTGGVIHHGAAGF